MVGASLWLAVPASACEGKGPRRHGPPQAALDACAEAADNGVSISWVPADFLAQQDVQSWRDLQVWVDSDGPRAGSLTWSPNKALAAGLSIRPVADTVHDTLDWFRGLPDERRAELRSGLSAERERSVLAAWREAAGEPA